MPRNPYHYEVACGIDVMPASALGDEVGFEYRQADVVADGIPYGDSEFDSVSAYDFLEHVPRIAVYHTGKARSPFIHLMNEVYRVLKKDGIFLASTPAYPSPKAFQDPTHVNFITLGTHEYFLSPEPYASRYGFNGKFACIYAGWDSEKNARNPTQSKISKIYRNIRCRIQGDLSHVTWILRAIK